MEAPAFTAGVSVLDRIKRFSAGGRLYNNIEVSHAPQAIRALSLPHFYFGLRFSTGVMFTIRFRVEAPAFTAGVRASDKIKRFSAGGPRSPRSHRTHPLPS